MTFFQPIPWLIPALALPLLAGCALSAPRAPAVADGGGERLGETLEIAAFDPVMDQPEARWAYFVLVGETAAMRQQPGLAAAALVEALSIRADGEIAARATAYAIAADDMEVAARAAEAWQAAEPEAAAPREVLLRVYLRNDRREDALRQARLMANNHPGERGEGLRVLALALAQEPEHNEAALWVFESIVADTPDDPAAHYALGLLALRLDELGVAERAGRRAITLAPDQSEYALLLAGTMIRSGELEESEIAMAPALAASGDRASLRIGYARLLIDSGYNDAARVQMKRALEHDPANAEARQMLGLLAIEDGDNEGAYEQFLTLYERGQRREEAAYYLGRLSEEAGDIEAARGWYEKAVAGARSLDAIARLANAEAQLGDIVTARERLRDLRRAQSGMASAVYAIEGQMLYSVGEYSAAQDVFSTALSMFPYDNDLRYGHALTLEQLDRVADAETELRRILADDPDDPRALNALGYVLTLHTDRYDEAEALIARALQFEPDDPAILDSMGWVAFKKGDLERALEYLSTAHASFPDPEVAAHYGEVLWVLGRREEAREVWREALETSPDHSVLRETVDRLDP
jgi:tetratricopeptide (TPR) repeat protein